MITYGIIGLTSHLRRKEPAGKPCDRRCHYGAKKERSRHHANRKAAGKQPVYRAAGKGRERERGFKLTPLDY